MVKGRQRAKFDEDSGAPLNDAARAILARHREDADAVAAANSVDAALVFDTLPEIDLAEGIWKYILLEISLNDKRRHIVRALHGLHYHAEIYELTAAQLRPIGIRSRVIGGGRIKMNSMTKTIEIYGYSKTFGRAPGCNQHAADIIRRNVSPDFKIDWSDAGY